MINIPATPDKTELFHDAFIQHGPMSNRIYLMKLKKANPARLIPAMDELANKNGYTKIFAKIPVRHGEMFFQSGYQKEALVPGFFHGNEDAIFLGRYIDPERQNETELDNIEEIIELARGKKTWNPDSPLSSGTIRICTPEDAKQISGIYKQVFESYPFPIDNPDYIIDTMNKNIIYFGIEINGKLVSMASAEMDETSGNVEMTDFATLPEFRGKNYASFLLACMEKEMKAKGIKAAYTIARSVSPAMNITFSKAGYKYGGRLVNNTNIAGQIESMNIWFKPL